MNATRPKVRTVLVCTVPNESNVPVFKSQKVLVSLWLLFGRWAPKIPREVLECN